MDSIIPDFTYLNGEYILKEFYKLNNMNEVLKWTKENLHLPYNTLKRILNYGFIYYINDVKYLQDEIINFLDGNRKKLIIIISKDELKKELQIFLDKYKNVKDINKDTIYYL
jgi:hypothetical protein